MRALRRGRVYHDRLTPRRHRFQARAFPRRPGRARARELPIPTRWSLRLVPPGRLHGRSGAQPARSGPRPRGGRPRASSGSRRPRRAPQVWRTSSTRSPSTTATTARNASASSPRSRTLLGTSVATCSCPGLGSGAGHRWRFAKDFVSPFHPMEHEYDWSFRTPGEHLTVHRRTRRPARRSSRRASLPTGAPSRGARARPPPPPAPHPAGQRGICPRRSSG